MLPEQEITTPQVDEILPQRYEIKPEMNQRLRKAREQDFPIKLFYSEMRLTRERGDSVLDIGSSIDVDSAELPSVSAIIETAHKRSVADRNYVEYASSYGTQRLRTAISDFFARWGGVNLDSNQEVMVTGGIIDSVKRVIKALELTHVIVPSWAPYFGRSLATLYGKEVIVAPIDLETGNYDLEALDERLRQSKLKGGRGLMYSVNPSAPLGMVMSDQFITDQLIPFLRDKGIWCISDSYVVSTRFDGTRITPMIGHPGFSDVGVEAITVSKELHLPGARAGGIAGNTEIINAVRQLASEEIDIVSGVNQELAAVALERGCLLQVSDRIARELRDEILPRFSEMGWPVIEPKAGIDMVIEVSPGFKDCGYEDPSLLASFSLLRRFGVAMCPCSVFGPDGKDYLRLVLKQQSGKIPAALDHLRQKKGFEWKTDRPSAEDIQYLRNRTENLDLTRL